MSTTSLNREQLEAYWMPFTGNRQFKRDPRMVVAAEGVYLIDDQGRKILDGLSGLWCCGAGHNRPEIAEAVYAQMQVLDYAPAFQFGHPGAFELANNGTVLVGGQPCPAIGSVSLNHYLFDATDVDAQIGDVVEVIAREGTNDLVTTAETAGWMVYSLLNHLSPFVPRVYYQNGVPVALEEVRA